MNNKAIVIYVDEYQQLKVTEVPVVAKDYCLWVASNDLKDLI